MVLLRLLDFSTVAQQLSGAPLLTKSWFAVIVVLTAVFLFGCTSSSSALNTRTPPQTVPQKQHSSAVASVIAGRVVKVVDGDTIDILDRKSSHHRIRLKGIDAPERGQAFGIEATQSLAKLVTGREVNIEWNRVDDSNRIIGKVLLDQQDICLEQIRAGMAWHFKRYQGEQSNDDRGVYNQVETEARSARRGLWTDVAPTEPWVVREHQRRGSSQGPEYTRSDTAVIRDFKDKLIRGNKRSMIYHWPGCPNYDDIAMHNRILFSTREEAEQAGYRAARNCQ
jgi:endonuclease YncB( thermonuclease family)